MQYIAGIEFYFKVTMAAPPHHIHRLNVSWLTYLFDEFAAQRDVGTTEDISHVSRDTQVIFFIRLWHLDAKYDEHVTI